MHDADFLTLAQEGKGSDILERYESEAEASKISKARGVPHYRKYGSTGVSLRDNKAELERAP